MLLCISPMGNSILGILAEIRREATKCICSTLVKDTLLQPNLKAERLIRYGMIIVGYSNILASMYGGIFDARGTMPTADSALHDLVVFYAFMPGVIAIFVVLGAMASSLRNPA